MFAHKDTHDRDPSNPNHNKGCLLPVNRNQQPVYKDDQMKRKKIKREKGDITTLSLPFNLPSAESFGSSFRPTWHLQTGVLDNRKTENQPAPCKKPSIRKKFQTGKQQRTRFWNNINKPCCSVRKQIDFLCKWISYYHTRA